MVCHVHYSCYRYCDFLGGGGGWGEGGGAGQRTLLTRSYNTIASDVLYFNILGRPVVVLNSVEAAADLLNKRGSNYQDRPRFVLFEVYVPYHFSAPIPD